MEQGIGQGWSESIAVSLSASVTQPPPVRDRNGVITGYNLYYRVTPSAGVGVTSAPYTKVVAAPTGCYQLGGLVGNTSYDVIVQAFTSAGSGPNSTVVMATALSE